MSEVNVTPEELVEEIDYEVEDAEVIPTPIDPTLTHPGEAAEAKAVGDALRNISQNIKVNNKTADETGNIAVYAGDILMSNAEGAQTVAQTVEAVQGRTAENILFMGGEADSIATVVNNVINGIEAGVSEADIDAIFDNWDEEEE